MFDKISTYVIFLILNSQLFFSINELLRYLRLHQTNQFHFPCNLNKTCVLLPSIDGFERAFANCAYEFQRKQSKTYLEPFIYLDARES